MLRVDELKNQIQQGYDSIIIPAIELCVYDLFGQESPECKEKAQDFAKHFKEMTSDAMSDILANAIDYHVKNIDISGQIMIMPGLIQTAGSPFSHVSIAPVIVQIQGTTIPSTNGVIPNSFGIS